MSDRRIGIAVRASDGADAVASIRRLEDMGIDAAWLTTGGTGMDGLTVLAAAAASTSSIMLGTAIVPILPRHPIVVAQQAQVVASLAPGRLRVGVGPSHRPAMSATFGLELTRPLSRLREYVRALKPLLQSASVEFEGEYYTARGALPAPLDIPVLVSALRPASFDLAGEEADGAISWVAPMDYLAREAIPALAAGAARAEKPTPPLFVHGLVSADENRRAVAEAVREHFAIYPRLPFYAAMFEQSGRPPGPGGAWTEDMIDAIVVFGNEGTLADRIVAMLDAGADELLLSVVPTGQDPVASSERTLRVVAKIAASLRR